MAELRLLAAVALGAALGGLARYGAGVALTRGPFAWGTVAVNLLGSFALGFLVFGPIARGGLGPEARLFLTTGFLGGFTTMSAFAVETLNLTWAGDRAGAGLYWALNAVGTLGAVLAGRAVAMAVG